MYDHIFIYVIPLKLVLFYAIT